MKFFKINYLLFLLVFFLFSSCCSNKAQNQDALKEEISRTEKEFETAAKEKGVAEAFYFYADENAVIKRAHDTLVRGKENIRKYYANPIFKNASVEWTPDFIGVSDDGTLGYTFGKYIWKEKDSARKISEFKGVFHTVWRRQLNGTWRYVWD